MKFLRTEAWQYTVLLIVLFAIASVAVGQTLAYLHPRVDQGEYRVVAAIIWSITLGFMLIAGSFGLWAIQLSGKAEARRRVGRFVDAMDYMSDGVLTVDRRKRVTGSNPAARAMGCFPEGNSKARLDEVFPCLTEDDVVLLIGGGTPTEVERRGDAAAEGKTLRFRSQPSESLTIILISDVTAMDTQRRRNRQMARLELLGHIAKGVANDFNSLLCGIAGHASILSRVPPSSPEGTRSTHSIAHSAERGIVLAGRLLELVQPATSWAGSGMIKEHVESAATVLRDGLSRDWSVEVNIDPIPPVALTATQIEQMVLNLGFLVADTSTRPGILSITVSGPESAEQANAMPSPAGTLLIRTVETANGSREPVMTSSSSDAGIIQSVIQSMVKEAGGKLEAGRSPGGGPAYRVTLPMGALPAATPDDTELPEELGEYVSHWSVLLAIPSHQQSHLQTRLENMGAGVDRVGDIVSALARVESEKTYDGMVIDKSVLKHEIFGLLRAIIKLSSRSGIVVLCEDPSSEPLDLSAEIVFVPVHASPSKIVVCMMEAKSLALKRMAG